MRKNSRFSGCLKLVCVAFLTLSCVLGACGKAAVAEPDDNYRVYYEIFVRSFADSNGDGIGDLNGAKEKIEYIKDLGATGVWLMPVMPSDTYHKYDVKDFMAIDPEYGTIDDFKGFVDECHANGIRVVIDMDINHTSSKHPWFVEACDYLRSLPEGTQPNSIECKYFDYYNFSTEKVNGSYYQVAGTSYYYEGVFWEEMPDLNLECTELRNELNTAFDFWLNLGVDGFRMDAACHYNDEDDEFNKLTLHEIYEYCKAKNPDFYMVNEVWENEDVIARYYESKTTSMFNFDLAGPEGKLIKAAKGKYSAEKLAGDMVKYEEEFGTANPDYIDATFVTNHDMGRVANALMSDEEAMKFAGGLNLIMRGSPYVYYGEEIGMKSKGTKDENKRLAMQWNEGNGNEMCDNPPDADAGIEQSFGSVDSQKDNPDSIYSYYKNAIAVRRSNHAIARGTTELLASFNDGDVAVIKRTYNEDYNVIVINTGEKCDISLIDEDSPEHGINPKGLKVVGTMLVNNSEEITYDNKILSIPAKSIVVLK